MNDMQKDFLMSENALEAAINGINAVLSLTS